MKSSRIVVFALLSLFAALPTLSALEKQPASIYRQRRVELGAKLQGGVAILFAAEEPLLDFLPYRQDEDFYYLTGWNEPGAALLIVGDSPQTQSAPARNYTEILFLPTRDLRMEKYTGIKLDAVTPGAAEAAGVDSVEAMTELPKVLNRLIAPDHRLFYREWTQPTAPQGKALVSFIAATLAMGEPAPSHDVGSLIQQLRVVKDPGEIELLKKASDASIAGSARCSRR